MAVDPRDTIRQLKKPVSEIELAEVMSDLEGPGVMVIRRLAYERGALRQRLADEQKKVALFRRLAEGVRCSPKHVSLNHAPGQEALCQACSLKQAVKDL